jgi:hypothetical protein
MWAPRWAHTINVFPSPSAGRCYETSPPIVLLLWAQSFSIELQTTLKVIVESLYGDFVEDLDILTHIISNMSGQFSAHTNWFTLNFHPH